MHVYQPDKEAVELAVKACRAVKCDFAGVDLLFGREGYLVCEVNSNAHFKKPFGLYQSKYCLVYSTIHKRSKENRIMPNELWMIYDKTGLDRNSTFVEMFAERGKPYNIDVKSGS